MAYNHQEIEKKWQQRWEEAGVFRAHDGGEKPKFYCLIEFPYPSGEGLHVGHPRSYTALDVVARKRRAQGMNVLYPIGWDAFGLPTENYAIKTGRKPQDITRENTVTFRRQLKSLGLSFDWSREVNTTDPEYYKWTQWMFLEFFRAGLAYKATQPINWCLSCKIGLANEEVVNGKCERCGGATEKRDKAQWMIAITKYAERLLADLDGVDYLEKIKAQQRNWIGKSEGAEIVFEIPPLFKPCLPAGRGGLGGVSIFTTRPDTIFGATFLVISPELAKRWIDGGWQASEEVRAYVLEALARPEMDRANDEREKTGVDTGVRAVNPANGESIPVWVADYVLGSYGTGAIMAVPAHDARDFAFAQKYQLPIVEVVIENPPPARGGVRGGGSAAGETLDTMMPHDVATSIAGQSTIDLVHDCFEGDGVAVNSAFLNGKLTTAAKAAMIEWLESKGVGTRKTTYKLRDWVFSRQRYWGEPIPLVHCDACAAKKWKFVFIHGFHGNATNCFFGTLRAKLEALGHEVVALDLPNANAPHADEQVEFLLKHAMFDERTVIVGHSHGSIVMHKLLARLEKPVAKSVFVDGFVASKFADRARPLVEASCDYVFDFEAARRNAGEVVVLGDSTGSVIPREQNEALAVAYQTTVQWAHPTDDHFCDLDEPAVFGAVVPTGWIPVPDEQLPVTLPDVERYVPTDTGESPLAAIESWVKTTCPRCGSAAKRETDTMPNWAGSSWYFLAYAMHSELGAKLSDQLPTSNFQLLNYWMPVDLYNGGMEHTTLHLLYSRFWNKFLFDRGRVSTSEPYARRHSHGLVLAADGSKMSKSKGNVVNPDEIVREYGADALRMYILFMGPFEEPVPWSMNGVVGVRRFLEKVERYIVNWRQPPVVPLGKGDDPEAKAPLLPKEGQGEVAGALERSLKKISDDVEAFKFNTAVAAFMSLFNEIGEATLTREQLKRLLVVLCSFAPHLANECWEMIGENGLVEEQPWPTFDERLLVRATVDIAVQVNGKARATISIAPDADEAIARAAALVQPAIMKYVEGKEIAKFVYVPGRIVNVVVK